MRLYTCMAVRKTNYMQYIIGAEFAHDLNGFLDNRVHALNNKE